MTSMIVHILQHLEYEQLYPVDDRNAQLRFHWSQLPLKHFKEVNDMNQHFYELKK